MSAPTPKEFFRKHHKEDADKLAEVINEPWFYQAVNAARAEMMHLELGAEVVKGANIFLVSLYGLTQDDPNVEQIPDHSELKTYGT